MAPEAGAQTVSQIEVEELVHNQVVRRRLLPRAVLVGLASGALAVGFRAATQLAEDARMALSSHLASAYLRFAATALLAAGGTYLAMVFGRLEPESAGSGIPQMKAVLEGHLKLNWVRVLWTKFLGGASSLGAGLALGREGPSIQMGGAVAQGLSSLTRSTPRERRALIAAGSGAGLAGAFNAPLAGVTFVLEELQRDFQPVVFVAALLAAALATVVSRLVSGQFPVLTVPPIETPPMGSLPVFVALGLLGGVGGVLFNKSLLKCISLFQRARSQHPLALAAFIGLVLAGMATLSPLLLGGGHKLTEAAIYGRVSVAAVFELFALRFVLIHFSYSTGVPGGIFAPLLSLGALLGVAGFALAGSLGLGGGLTLAACAVAGMCAMFAGIVRAPLTGVVLIVEITGSYGLLLPLLVTAFSAYTVAESLRDTPIYEALLQRLSESREFAVDDEERQFVEFEIRGGSPLSGKPLRDAGLPPGTLVVLYSAAGKEFIPNGDTVLEEHAKLSVFASSSEAAHSLELMTRSL